jgi:hypothetical protein
MLPPCSGQMFDFSLLVTSIFNKKITWRSRLPLRWKLRLQPFQTWHRVFGRQASEMLPWRSTRLVSAKVHVVTFKATIILNSKNVLHDPRSCLHISDLFLNPLYAGVTTCFASDDISNAVTRKKMLHPRLVESIGYTLIHVKDLVQKCYNRLTA